jgi:hypothetical protein
MIYILKKLEKTFQIFFSKFLYLLIILSVVNFLISIVSLNKDNPIYRMNKDYSLEDYVISSKKGETYLFSKIVREYLINLNINNADIYYSFGKKDEKMSYFMSVFSDGIAEILLYPYNLVRDDELNVVLDINNYDDLQIDDWKIVHFKKIDLFLPMNEPCNEFKIMVLDEVNVFLKPIC